MDIFAIVGMAMVCCVLCLILKQTRPEYAMITAIGGGILIFIVILSQLTQVFDAVKELSKTAQINESYIKAIIKALGICYITSFGSDACCDAGQTALAGKLELLGKVMVVIISLPIFDELIKIVFSLISMKG